MSAPPDWNPYSEWLAIPPSQLPPEPHQLLGLRTSEVDVERIQRSSQRQLRRIEPHLHGPHADWASRLLAEVTSATELLTARALSVAPDELSESMTAEESATVEGSMGEETDSSLVVEPSVEAVMAWSSDDVSATPRLSRASSRLLGILLVASLSTLTLLSVTAGVVLYFADRPTNEQRHAPAEEAPNGEVATDGLAVEAPKVERDGCWEQVVRLDSPTTADGDIVRVKLACSPADESFASLSEDGRSLVFVRRTKSGNEVHRLTRPDPSRPFDTDWICRLDGMGVGVSSLILVGMGDLVFGRSKASGVEFVQASRGNEDFTYHLRALLAPQRGAERDVFITPAGTRLLFSRRIEGVYHIYESRRADAMQRFNSPLLSPVAEGYRHPTMSADHRLLVMEGRAPDGRVALYGARRPSENSAWGEPICLEKLRSPTGQRGDYTPRLSPDGTLLFFASDRDGGAGLLDIYQVTLSSILPPAD